MAEKNADAAQVLDALADAGVRYVVLEFSGGHDEGYVQGSELYGEPKEGAEVPADSMEAMNCLHRTHESVTVGDELAARLDALEFPIYDHYHSFAGDFSVFGHVFWSVADRTGVLQAEETTWVDQPVVTVTVAGG